ncbi:hypothetical protein J2X57_003289 [Luteibacter sp. 1214]|nr:hypothetical protein [Luteibacter sp. 1214]SDF21217.1 hypothetical protein SAMN04515659_0400 [Dyella sp. 333MFSha]
MQNFLWIVLWLPMIALGHTLSTILFKTGSPASYAFFMVWPFANFYLAYKLCKKGDDVLVIRLISFFLTELAILAVVLLYFG